MRKKLASRILCTILIFVWAFAVCAFAEGETQNIAKGSDKAAVKEVQQLLINAGFLPAGQDDGIYGPKTERAVRNFQEMAPSLYGITLNVTGSCDADTLELLRKASVSVSAGDTQEDSPVSVQDITENTDPDLIEELSGYEKVFDEYISYLKKHPVEDDDSSTYSLSGSDDEEKKAPDTTELSERSDSVSAYISAYSAVRRVGQRSLSEADRAYYNEFKARIDKKLSDAGIG